MRVVLGEIDSPGPLHYLIEGEGFQVVGCASNDAELARVLAHVEPDVVVLDADVSATSALVAREGAPSSELIVLWPEGVQLPSGAERVHPRLVYQDLGPAIRKAAEDRRTRHPTVVEPEDDDPDARPTRPTSIDVYSSTAQRTSTRVLVGTAALIALIVMTMGVSFALEGRSGSPQPTVVRTIEPSPSAIAGPRASTTSATSPPSRTGDGRPSVHTRCAPGAKTDRKTPNEHAAAAARAATPACAGGRGSTHPAPHEHGNNRGNGSATGRGNAHGGGNAHANGGGNAQANGAGTKDAKSDPGAQGRSQGHPSGPPATPGSARNGPPG